MINKNKNLFLKKYISSQKLTILSHIVMDKEVLFGI